MTNNLVAYHAGHDCAAVHGRDLRAVGTAALQRHHAEHDCSVAHAIFKDTVGYVGAHDRMKDIRLQPCAHCGIEGKSEAALLKGRGDRLDEKRGLWYSMDADAYIPLCRSCHRRYDES